MFSQEQINNITVKYINNGAIKLDGKLDETEWQSAEKGDDFWQFFPTDSAKSVNSTEFRLLYDDHTLYIGVRAEVKSDNYVVSSLRRDFSGTSNDNVTLMFDTYNDGTTAFLFGMTPYGVQREAFVSGGGSGSNPLNVTWDQIAIIPYINTLTSKNFANNTTQSKLTYGGDAKIAIGNSLNLDVTVNPDFSNVEVDDVFTNLTRFEVLLPEKRQFFIDNNDLFGNYGDANSAAKPFFSRRIGLARDAVGNLIENRIIAGARLSGKIGQDWRLGLLNIQTDEDVPNQIASNNNMMFTVQRKVFSRSNIGLFAINRQAFNDYDFLNQNDEYNRVVGAEYNLASEDNSWTGKFYLHKSFQPNDTKGNLSSQATVTYNNRKFTWIADLMYVDQGFRSDLGFIPRTDILKNGNGLSYNFYPSNGKISNHGPGAMALYYWKPTMDYMKTDHTYQLYYDLNFKNQSTLHFVLNNQHVYLTHDFDPTRSGGVPISGNKDYTYNFYTLNYQSNSPKILALNSDPSI